MREINPVIGGWYRRPGFGLFEVVATDDDDRTIDIQYFDGTLEELEVDTWKGLYLEEAQPPEDWTGSMDVGREDAEPGGEDVPQRDFASPLDFFDRV